MKISQKLQKLSTFKNCNKAITSILKFQALLQIGGYFEFPLGIHQKYLNHIRTWVLLFHNQFISRISLDYFQSYIPSKVVTQKCWQSQKLRRQCTFGDISGIWYRIIVLVSDNFKASYYFFINKLFHVDISTTFEDINLAKMLQRNILNFKLLSPSINLWISPIFLPATSTIYELY